MKGKLYVSPDLKVLEAIEPEGLICSSMRFNVHVQELENMNVYEDEEGFEEEFYFKS